MENTDLEQVCAIENESFSQPWSKNDFIKSIENEKSIYLVIDIDGIIAGYCGMLGVIDEGQINNVAVKSDFRNKGIGYLMLEKLLEYGKNQNLVSFTLEVRISNIAAITLYHKLGFVDIGIRKKYYEKPKEDALIMWKY